MLGIMVSGAALECLYCCYADGYQHMGIEAAWETARASAETWHWLAVWFRIRSIFNSVHQVESGAIMSNNDCLPAIECGNSLLSFFLLKFHSNHADNPLSSTVLSSVTNTATNAVFPILSYLALTAGCCGLSDRHSIFLPASRSILISALVRVMVKPSVVAKPLRW